MAQISYSANLSAADFVLSFSFKGQSVVIPGVDQNTLPNLSLSGSTAQKGLNVPQLYYCENVVPTSEGYRSVQYQYFIEPPLVPGDFVKMYTVFDGETNSAVIGVTRDRRLYILSFYSGGLWVPLALPAGTTWTVNSRFTTATVVGMALFCIEGVGIFELDIPTSSCTRATVLGIDDTLMRGITTSSNYLIAFDATKVYWSSTLNPLDFTPSLITGAGSETPTGLKGSIRICREIAGGFIVYSDVNMVSAAFTSSLNFPFVFVVLQGGAGIRSEDGVAYDSNQTNHFAWTSAGLLRIELHNAELIAPQITDFIGSGLMDRTTSFDGYPTTDRNSDDKEVRLAYLSSRYLALSFGYLNTADESTRLPQPELSQTFLYDTQLNRWGKLNVNHIQLLEVPFAGESQVFFLTSKPYAIDVTGDALRPLNTFEQGKLFSWGFWNDRGSFSNSMVGGNLREAVKVYSVPQEPTKFTNTFVGGNLKQVLIAYNNWPYEPMKFNSNFVGGTLRTALITYSNWPIEPIKFSNSFVGGSLT